MSLVRSSATLSAPRGTRFSGDAAAGSAGSLSGQWVGRRRGSHGGSAWASVEAVALPFLRDKQPSLQPPLLPWGARAWSPPPRGAPGRGPLPRGRACGSAARPAGSVPGRASAAGVESWPRPWASGARPWFRHTSTYKRPALTKALATAPADPSAWPVAQVAEVPGEAQDAPGNLGFSWTTNAFQL